MTGDSVTDDSETGDVAAEAVGDRPVEQGEIVDPPEQAAGEAIEQPAKVMRVGAMMRQLLEELRGSDLDAASRERLKEIHETSINELRSALSPDLHDELTRLALPFKDDDEPTDAELLVAKAQLVGWLEGLVQGIQATLFAQQLAAQQQLANMRGPGQLPPGAAPQPQQPQQRRAPSPPPGGTYL